MSDESIFSGTLHTKKILYIPLEFTSWNSARYWSYSYPWGIEEILRHECAECLTVPSLFGLPASSPQSWLYYLKNLCRDKNFDQVWFTANHTQLDDNLLGFLAELIPVRVALFAESLIISAEEWSTNPDACIQRNEIVERCLRYATHAVVPDEFDVELLRKRDVPAFWLPAVISSQFIADDPGPATRDHAVFFGAPYGKRGMFLKHPALENVLVRPEGSLEEATDLPQQFNQLHEALVQQLVNGNSSEKLLNNYLKELREIRKQCFRFWMQTLSEAPVVVNLPQYGKMYSGRVAEAMAAGRPVVAARISDRPETQSLFMEDRDILLYDENDPVQLAEQIKRLLNNKEYAETIACNARKRIREIGTAEECVREIFNWMDLSSSSAGCVSQPPQGFHQDQMPRQLIVYPHSGFSNRLKGFVSASLFDKAFKVYWKPEDFCGLRYADLFCDTQREIDHIPPDAFLLDTWRFELPNGLRALIPEGFSDCATGFKGIYFPGDNQSRNIDFEYLKIPPAILATLGKHFSSIRFSKDILDRVNARLREMPDQFVGVHARTWHDEPERKQKWFDFDAFVKACSRFQDKELFVTSDDPAFVKNLSAALNKKLIIFERAGQRAPKPWQQNSSEEMLDDIVELLVLSKASHLVLTAMSTYSEAAWFLGGCTEEVYFADPDFKNKGKCLQAGRNDNIGFEEQNIRWIEIDGNTPYSLALITGCHIHLDTLNGGIHKIGDYVEKYSGYMKGSAPEDYMIDVGANLGLSAFPVASMPRRVIAFEPVADNVKAMKQSIAHNRFDNVTLVECAVSSRVGETNIYVPLGRSDNASFGEDVANANVSSPEVIKLTVPTDTIDHWFGEHEIEFRPADARLLKVDVQGYETAVIQGAKDFIAACRQFEKLILEFEFDPKLTKMAGYSTLDLLELIHSYGLEIYYNGKRLATDHYAEFCRQDTNCDLIAAFRPRGDAGRICDNAIFNLAKNSGMNMGNNMYGQEFYDSQIFGSLQSAQIYLYHLFSIWGVPERVVDIGCGRGAWLATCHDFGVRQVVGVDGDWNSQEAMLDSAISFHPANLEQRLNLPGSFDMAISIEVAEHLSPESSDTFVESLSNLAEVVMFGAAFTGQPGVNHINTRPHSFWAEKFFEQGFVLFDLFRPSFWNDDRIEPCYRQNTFLYVKPGHALYRTLIDKGITYSREAPFIDCVHPAIYLGLLDEFNRLRQSSGAASPETQVQDQCRSAVRSQTSTDALDSIESLLESAAGLVVLDRLEDAADTLRLALTQNPNHPECLLRLSHVLLRMKRYDESFHHARRFLRTVDNVAFGYYLAGHAGREIGRWQESRSYLKRAVELDPSHIYARVLLCMSSFTVCMSESETVSMAQTYADELEGLIRNTALDTADRIDNAFEGIGSLTPFFLPYLGCNVRDFQQEYGTWVCKIMAAKYPQFSRPPLQRSPTEKIKIGIISNYFHNHSNWKIPIRGWLEQLDRKIFSIHCFYTGEVFDMATESARSLADHFHQNGDVDSLAKTLHDEGFDVLIYPGIGMDTVTLKLAALRLAPVQCASWGHPVTTGMPTIDYYISSDLMEPADADRQYSEKLVRLPNLSLWYEPAESGNDPSSNIFIPGLGKDDVIYLCCQNILKYLPGFDSVFPEIAGRAKNARFIFIASPVSELTEKFVERLDLAFKSHGLNIADHVIVLPQLNGDDFSALNARADVFLDSIEWSGCNTIFESLPFNKPIVTLPGSFMRGRHAYALLKMIGVEDTIAADMDEYISIAVRLGNDRIWRDEISARISIRKHRAYQDRECISGLEKFLMAVSGRS